MRSLHFTKMQAAGNDFVVLDNRKKVCSKEKIIALAPNICDRRFGVGGDGIISLEAADQPSLDYSMFYRNPDGSDAGMCGNGARCLALLASTMDLGDKLTFNVHQNIYHASVNKKQQYVQLIFPMTVQPQKVLLDDDQIVYKLYTGTEHIVRGITSDIMEDKEVLRNQGARLRYHQAFDPPGTNVNFIKGKSPQKIMIQTYERGVEDLTLACGTGAIAGAIAWDYMQQTKRRNNNITVEAEGGTLEVSFTCNRSQNEYFDIMLSGEARAVFEGDYAF